MTSWKSTSGTCVQYVVLARSSVCQDIMSVQDLDNLHEDDFLDLVDSSGMLTDVMMDSHHLGLQHQDWTNCWGPKIGLVSTDCSRDLHDANKPRSHLKDRFCASCRRDGIEVPLDCILALPQTHCGTFQNTGGVGFWNAGHASGISAFRIINQTAACDGPALLLFASKPTDVTRAKVRDWTQCQPSAFPELPAEWINSRNGTSMRLWIARGTLVPRPSRKRFRASSTLPCDTPYQTSSKDAPGLPDSAQASSDKREECSSQDERGSASQVVVSPSLTSISTGDRLRAANAALRDVIVDALRPDATLSISPEMERELREQLAMCESFLTRVQADDASVAHWRGMGSVMWAIRGALDESRQTGSQRGEDLETRLALASAELHRAVVDAEVVQARARSRACAHARASSSSGGGTSSFRSGSDGSSCCSGGSCAGSGSGSAFGTQAFPSVPRAVVSPASARAHQVTQQPTTRRQSTPWIRRVLITATQLPGTPDVGNEARAVAAVLSAVVEVVLILDGLSASSLDDALDGCDAWLFCGHGDALFGGGRAALTFTNPLDGAPELIAADSLATIAGKHATHELRCVLLNGCSTLTLGERISKAGVESVTCWATPVRDEAAFWFGFGFANALAIGESPSGAFAAAKAAMLTVTVPRCTDDGAFAWVPKYCVGEPTPADLLGSPTFDSRSAASVLPINHAVVTEGTGAVSTDEQMGATSSGLQWCRPARAGVPRLLIRSCTPAGSSTSHDIQIDLTKALTEDKLMRAVTDGARTAVMALVANLWLIVLTMGTLYLADVAYRWRDTSDDSGSMAALGMVCGIAGSGTIVAALYPSNGPRCALIAR